MADDLGPKEPSPNFHPDEAPGALTEEERGRLEDDNTRAWFDKHLGDLRRTASGERPLYWLLILTFVIGLGVHAGGFLLKINVTTESAQLFADLLYTLGWALWTGVVVVLFLQVIPETKRRQIKRALDAFEAGRRDGARKGREPGERRGARLPGRRSRSKK